MPVVPVPPPPPSRLPPSLPPDQEPGRTPRGPVPPASARKVAEAALASGLLRPREGVLVALSGGADSTALAGLLAEAAAHGLPLRLVLAHLDHGWRGPEEARADREAAGHTARQLGLALVTAGPPEPPAPGEDAARRWRYATLARLAREQGLLCVATGHHLGDQAETFLLRLLRGSGPAGLAGIHPERPLDHGRLRVVRPLLALTPEALRAFNRARGLAWRDDPTNAGPGARNEVRRRLALLEARQHGARDHLARLADRLRGRVERATAALTARLAPQVAVASPGHAASLPRAALTGLEGEALALALRVLGRSVGADAHGPWLTRRHVRLAEDVLRDGGALDLPRGLVLRAGSVRAWLLRRGPWPVERYRLTRRDVPRAAFPLAAFLAEAAPWSAALDADVLGAGPRLGTVEAGDVFTPLGRGATHSVPVAAWLQRRGVPRAVRRSVPLVRGAHGTAWVAGQRVDAAHAVTERTRTVALLSVVPADAGPAAP